MMPGHGAGPTGGPTSSDAPLSPPTAWPVAPSAVPTPPPPPVAPDGDRADPRLARALAALAALVGVLACVAPVATWHRLSADPLAEGRPAVTATMSGWGTTQVDTRSRDGGSGAWDRWTVGPVPDGMVASGIAVLAVGAAVVTATSAGGTGRGRRPARRGAAGVAVASIAGLAWCGLSWWAQLREARRPVTLVVGVLEVDESFFVRGIDASVGGGLVTTVVAFAVVLVLTLLALGALEGEAPAAG